MRNTKTRKGIALVLIATSSSLNGIQQMVAKFYGSVHPENYQLVNTNETDADKDAFFDGSTWRIHLFEKTLPNVVVRKAGERYRFESFSKIETEPAMVRIPIRGQGGSRILHVEAKTWHALNPLRKVLLIHDMANDITKGDTFEILNADVV